MAEKQKLNAPRDFIRVEGAVCPSSPTLLTPSHFAVTSDVPPVHATSSKSGPGQMPALDPWVIIHQKQQQLQELRRENQRLTLTLQQHRDTQHRDYTLLTAHTHCSETERERERLRGHGEIQELRGEVERLKEELREQENISRQRAELIHYKEELDKKKEKVCEHHSEEILTLSNLNTHLENTLSSTTKEVTSLRQQVEEVTSEKERLQEQLSAQNSVLAEKNETLQKLRSYIGTHTGEEEQHTLLKKLQNEKEALCVSVELLKVRVQASNDILDLQERELREQCDPLCVDSKAGRLLSLWREKVFTLLVQLRSRDLQLQNHKSQLHNKVSDLQQEVQKLRSQISVFQRNLQDKTAQLELHNIHTQELQQQLCSAVEDNHKLREHKEKCEKSLRTLSDTAHSVLVCGDQMNEAQFQMKTLTQRLTFANKRLDTVHGLLLRREALRKVQQATKPLDPPASESYIERLQSEVAHLSSERDALMLELKRTPELIQNALRDLQQQLEREVGLLTQALSQSKTEMEECEQRRLEALRQCEEQEGTIAELQAEAHHMQQRYEEQERTIAELRAEADGMQQHWQNFVQEKTAEVERQCDEKLREMEALLNTARREHTKAVVALRQVERTVAREREQGREAERERSAHTQKQLAHLKTQLKNLDKERNILLAVIQQQGLMSEYQKMRRAAKQTPNTPQEQEQQQNRQHQGGEVLSMLGKVRSLSTGLIHSSEEEEDEDDVETQEKE
ncbi:coiled-coil alpha-helical rod protein 1 isoform X2 [Hoplias malabaricus]|uniref:coiled-coil alpha-helical rod protein 1 isoform X2 n=1 Tax=Hoplias malabaricus TaxID=27720 RepID=UPI003461F6AB